MSDEFGTFDLDRCGKKLIDGIHKCDYSICYNGAFTFGAKMIEFFTSGYGLSSLGLIGIILFLLYLKLMKWVFKIAFLGVLVLGAFWYFKGPAIG